MMQGEYNVRLTTATFIHLLFRTVSASVSISQRVQVMTPYCITEYSDSSPT